MGQNLDRLQPAPNREITMYLPYYQGPKRDILPLAMTLYQQGNFEGERGIEGGTNIPFLSTWSVSSLPADLTRCRMQFSGNSELSYEITLANFEFMGFLIDVLSNYRRSKVADFPKPFYLRLLKMDE